MAIPIKITRDKRKSRTGKVRTSWSWGCLVWLGWWWISDLEGHYRYSIKAVQLYPVNCSASHKLPSSRDWPSRRCPPSLRRCKSLVLHLTIVVTTCSRKNVWNFNIKFSEFLLCNSQCTCLVNFKNIRISAEKRRKLGGISITSSPSDQIIASGSIAVAEARTRILKEKCNTLYLLMQFP